MLYCLRALRSHQPKFIPITMISILLTVIIPAQAINLSLGDFRTLVEAGSRRSEAALPPVIRTQHTPSVVSMTRAGAVMVFPGAPTRGR